jgi:hypothetical protein
MKIGTGGKQIGQAIGRPVVSAWSKSELADDWRLMTLVQ